MSRKPQYHLLIALVGVVAGRQLRSEDLPDLSVVSRALQEGAASFLQSPEARNAAYALQDAAKHVQESTQTVLSTPQAQAVASSLETAAAAATEGTTSFLQSKQASDTATAVGAAAGSVLTAGAKATDQGSRAVQDFVNKLVDDSAPDGAESPAGSSAMANSQETGAPGPKLSQKSVSKTAGSDSSAAAAAAEDTESAEELPLVLPKPTLGATTSFASRGEDSAGTAGAVDGLQLLQGLQAVMTTAAQMAQASSGAGVGAARAGPGPAGAPLGALETMAQTALSGPMFNGGVTAGQALVVLPPARAEALPPGVDPQSAQRVRQAAQGAINSLTISRSPNEQSVLAQLTSAVQQQKSPQEIARDGVNDIVNNRAQDFLGAITGLSPPPPPPPASLQDTIASVVSGIATQASQSHILENLANTLTGPATTATTAPGAVAGAAGARPATSAAIRKQTGQEFLQMPPGDVSDPIMDNVNRLVQAGMP